MQRSATPMPMPMPPSFSPSCVVFVNSDWMRTATTPGDLGMDWIVSKKKKDFLGRRSLSRTDTARADRKQLVGLLTADPNEVVPEGSQVVEEVRARPPMPMSGHVSSSYWSATLGRSIAMALIARGHSRHGEMVTISLPGKNVPATVTAPIFYDPNGEKLRG